MKAQECYIILIQKLNKLGTNTSQNIPFNAAVRAINEAQSYWYDQRIKVEEANDTIVRELQHMIKSTNLIGLDKGMYDTYDLPLDYYQLSSIQTIGYKGDCKVNLDVQLIENSNKTDLYSNGMSEPSLKFEQTIAALKTNTLNIYKKDFSLITSIDYYKKLKNVDLKGYKHFDNSDSTDIDLEFDGSSAYEILTIAAQLISGNIGDPVYQVHQNTTKQYN